MFYVQGDPGDNDKAEMFFNLRRCVFTHHSHAFRVDFPPCEDIPSQSVPFPSFFSLQLQTFLLSASFSNSILIFPL